MAARTPSRSTAGRNTPDSAAAPTPGAKKRKNARGRRQSHAVRLPGETAVLPAPRSATATKIDRGQQMRERILQAALECFGAFGFAGTSTRAVADRAGISHPLLIYHFQSKEQLWRSTMDDVIGRYREALEKRLQAVDPADAKAALQAFIENFVEFSARMPQLHRIMTQQSTQGSDRIEWLVGDGLRDSFDQICGLIRRGQTAGVVRQGDPARLYYAVIGLGGTLFSVSTEFRLLTGRDVFSTAEVRDTISTIFEFLFR